MNSRELNIYIQQLKEEHQLDISDELLEKDYILASFLSNWKKENTPNLDQLVFKGGTLLTKNYLEYHRISEDLDFTHKDSNQIRKIETTRRRETQIKNRVLHILEEIDNVAKLSKLDFQNDRNNEKYIQVKNSRSVYIISLHYRSQTTNLEQFIKIEINFIEGIQTKIEEEEIQTILDYYPLGLSLLQTINYKIERPKLLIYSIDEIILEKIRATITRYQFKPRDVFDLFLINKNHKNIFKTDYTNIKRKLDASAFEHDTKENMKRFLELELDYDINDIENLSLTIYDNEEFHSFEEKLIKFLKQITQRYLEVSSR